MNHGKAERRAGRGLGVALVCAMLAGCSITQPDPDKGEFAIVVPAAGAAAQPAPGTCLRVERVRVAVPFNQQSFMYRTGDSEFKTDYYNGFVAPPDRLLSGATVKALSDRGAAATVLDPGMVVGCDRRLETSVTDLYADLRPTKNQVVIKARFMLLRDSEGATTILGDWPMEAAETMLSPSPADIAAAYGRAYASLMTRVTKQIAAVKP